MNSGIINITGITSKLLREKKYINDLPEYYDLSKVLENNLWHSNQNVLDHVIAVFAGMEEMLQFKELDQKQKNYIEKYFSEKVGNLSRREILIVSVLLHDIGKSETRILHPDGTTSYPKHELISAQKVTDYSSRFGLSGKDREYIERIVANHSRVYGVLSGAISKGNWENSFAQLKSMLGDVMTEMIFLIHSDLLGSDLKQNAPDAFNDHAEILRWILQKELTK
jgi:hypothetical protein